MVMMGAQVAVILIPLIEENNKVAEHWGIDQDCRYWQRCTPSQSGQMYSKLFVSNMIPLKVVESKSFSALIKMLKPSKNSISFN